MCSDESLLQEDRSLSVELSGLHLRDASGQTNRPSRLASISSYDIASSNPSALNQRYLVFSHVTAGMY
jgi:dual specificity protein kinase YAK1